MRIGIGYDSHRLQEGRKLIIGGVEIDYFKGLKGHSDADVLTHAIIDALLGAAGVGDIGTHFPDNDSRWKDISSLKLLSITAEKLFVLALRVHYVDAVVIAEVPKLAPYMNQIRTSIASTLGITEDRVNIKAKTNEGMGFVGREEGIAAQAVCLLCAKDNGST